MNSAEIKVDLVKKIDSLKGNRLEEAYGILLNYINGKNELDDWQSLSQKQQDSIRLGIKQLINGKGKEHKKVMSAIRERYTNA